MRTVTRTEFMALRDAETTEVGPDGSWTCRTCGRRFSAISDHTHINPEPNGWQNAVSDPRLQIVRIEP